VASAAAFDQYIDEHRLMGARCKQCSRLYVPPRAICPQCHGDQLEWAESSGKGKLAAFTVIYSGPAFMLEQGFDHSQPYISGIVMLEEGSAIRAGITGLDATRPESINIGTALQNYFAEPGADEKKKDLSGIP
jgi:uncharacterized OB-fold protein